MKSMKEIENVETNQNVTIQNKTRKTESRLLSFTIDNDRKIQGITPMFQRIVNERFGLEVKNGMTIDEIPAEAVFKSELKQFIETASKGEAQSGVLYGPIDDGVLEIFCLPIVLDNNIVGVSVVWQDITERTQNERTLKINAERLRHLFDRAPLGYQSLNDKGFLLDVNEAWLKTLGYQHDEVVGKWLGDFMDPDQIPTLKSNFKKFREQGKLHAEYKMKHKDGHKIDVSIDGRIGYDKDGQFERTHCIVNDITEQKIAQQRLIESEERYRLLFSEMNQGIALYKIILDENGKPTDYSFTDVNDFFLEMFEMKREDVIGKRAKEVMPKVEEYWIEEFGRVALTGQSSNFVNYFETTGRYYDTHNYATEPGYFAVICRDITESRQAQENILYLSYHDQLTGLYNRRFYEEELKRLDVERNMPMTLVMGDINGLKLVNDSFGHAQGDELIIKVADAIRKACRVDDIVARFGGDEFVIILPRTETAEANKVVDRIKSRLIEINSGSIDISVSFGVQTKQSIDEETKEWIKKTEDDMYQHKVYESLSMRSRTIDLIMKTLFEKNSREMLHSKRVSEICVSIATQLGLGNDEINKIRLTGLMHDIGKIGIDEKILNSDQKLTPEEWVEIKKHPEIGSRILSASLEFAEIAEVVLQHHERWDGKGYPRGLKGEAISLNARIISIADAIDAMCSDRAYRKAYDEQFALSEILRGAGNQFDPQLVTAFVNLIKTNPIS